MRKAVLLLIISIPFLFGCSQFKKTGNTKKGNEKISYTAGEYGYDLDFLKKYITPVELVNGKSRLIVASEYQGRVMTSSSSGMKGNSHGWINYDFIASSKINEDANPYGGEERIWLGPEGGQFSIFFTGNNPGKWIVPSALDHETFNIAQVNSQQITLEKDIELVNRSATKFYAKISRTITLLDSTEIRANLKIGFGKSIRVVAYKSENRLKNIGNYCWNKDNGTLSIWMLSMMKASPVAAVIIPYKQGGQEKVVNDYFGVTPGNRLKVTDDAVFYRTDAEFRSKIGVSPSSALPCVGSYDAQKQILSILTYSLPENKTEYVNSALVDQQKDPFSGDVINSYNDGPSKNGSRIGQLYEMEISSPAAFLKPGEEITHVQCMYHFEGKVKDLDMLVRSLLNVSISEIENVFGN